MGQQDHGNYWASCSDIPLLQALIMSSLDPASGPLKHGIKYFNFQLGKTRSSGSTALSNLAEVTEALMFQDILPTSISASSRNHHTLNTLIHTSTQRPLASLTSLSRQKAFSFHAGTKAAFPKFKNWTICLTHPYRKMSFFFLFLN